MPEQFTTLIDERLNQLDLIIGNAILSRDDAQRKFDAAWAEVFTLFDRAQGTPGLKARFVTSLHKILRRDVPMSTESLDYGQLENALINVFEGDIAKAEQVYRAATKLVVTKTRVVDPEKLTKLVKHKRIPARAVELIHRPSVPLTARRVRAKATKDDIAFLAGSITLAQLLEIAERESA